MSISLLTAAALALTAGCGAPAPAGTTAAPEAVGNTAGPEAAIAASARPITGSEEDYADLFALAGGARRILLGESTHGTHEYYRERGRLTEPLVRDHGVNAIAIEADWGATQRVNLYVRGLGVDRSASDALRGYTRFPRWMWGNAEFAAFVERLRALNLERPTEQRVGLYGMDVYDLFDAADHVVAWLKQADPAAGAHAASRYRCFARHGRSVHAYGEATRRPSASCADEAAAVLAAVRRVPRPSGAEAAEIHFGAIRSAASVVAAEEYFRTVYTGSLAWNARDRRMAETVEAIAEHAEALSGRAGKIVMWAHNSHVGDARATFAARRGELNLGQLMREAHGEAALLVGLFSYEGTVMAASEWDAPGRVRDMRAALPDSYASLFHRTGIPAFSLLLRGNEALETALGRPMLQRAIGVVYLPETERQSHYFDAVLPRQFDATLFFDRTRAVTALRR